MTTEEEPRKQSHEPTDEDPRTPQRTAKEDYTEFVYRATRALARGSLRIALIAILFGTPLVVCARRLLERNVNLVSVREFLSAFESSPTEALGSVLNLGPGLRTDILLLMGSLIALLVVGVPASMRIGTQEARADERRGAGRALLGAIAGIPRTAVALALLIAALLPPLAAGPLVAADLLLNESDTWQEPLVAGSIGALAGLGVALWAGTRLAFLMPAAVDPRRRRMFVLAAVEATRCRWAATFARIATIAVVAAGANGLAWALLAPSLLDGSSESVLNALTVGVAVSAIVVMGAATGLGAAWQGMSLGSTAAVEVETSTGRGPHGHRAGRRESRRWKQAEPQSREVAAVA